MAQSALNVLDVRIFARGFRDDGGCTAFALTRRRFGLSHRPAGGEEGPPRPESGGFVGDAEEGAGVAFGDLAVG
jgi:hypothetical protein